MLIKYIKSVLWRIAKCLSYIEEVWCLKVKAYRIVILPVVLYGCETWSFILRGERRLRAFENRFLRRIFGSKRDEVAGEWRKLHNEEA